MHGLGDTTATKAQIVATANQYGVDPNLALAVAQQESGFQQTGSSGSTLTSSAGALGVFQLMPATAVGLGVNPNDQTQNIQGGVQLLSQLLTQFNGNVSLALAAYNAGPGAVQKYNGIPPYPETQNYVSSIMANYTLMGGSDTSLPASTTPTDATQIASDATDTSDFPTAVDASIGGIGDALGNIDPTIAVAIAAFGLLIVWAVAGRG